MNVLLWNTILALAWLALTGQFHPANFAAGFVLGYLVLWLARPALGSSNYFLKIPQVVSFIMFFLWQLVLANLRVAYSVLAPHLRIQPAVVAVPLDVNSDPQITLLANLITLTPGTLSLDISSDRRVLYVHFLHVDDVDRARREIKEGFERRVLEVFQ